MIDEYEERGDIIAIRPIRPIEVGRMEKDVDKLEALYKEGFDIGETFARMLLLMMFSKINYFSKSGRKRFVLSIACSNSH